jgi:hypothetical protein
VSETINIKLDFTGINAASGGLGYLSPGLHGAKVAEVVKYDDSNRIYVYMVTDGVRHRDSFNLDSAGALPFIKAFLLSAGMPENKLEGKCEIPFHKLAGRTVYFNYNPPEMDSAGKAVQGSYPKYTFYNKDRYIQMQEVTNLNPQDVEVEESNGAGAPVAQASKAKKSGDDFDFLLDD